MNRSLIRHGFALLALGLMGGFAIPHAAIPRLALSAHSAAMIGAVLLIAIGAVWSQFRLAIGPARLLAWAWLVASYGNWFGCLVGAWLGAGRMTPVAAAGVEGTPAAELFLSASLTLVVLASFTGVSLALWGLRGR